MKLLRNPAGLKLGHRLRPGHFMLRVLTDPVANEGKNSALVEAERVGEWMAVHPNLKSLNHSASKAAAAWAVTHIPSGRRVISLQKRVQALETAADLQKLPFKWSGTAEQVVRSAKRQKLLESLQHWQGQRLGLKYERLPDYFKRIAKEERESKARFKRINVRRTKPVGK